MIHTSEKMLELFRTPGPCELCGKLCRRREPHHCFTRGCGGGQRLDVRWNLIAVGSSDGKGCRCHQAVQEYRIPRRKVLEIIAAREGITADDIENAVHVLRRFHKDACDGAIEIELAGQSPTVRGLVWGLVMEVRKKAA